MKHIPEPRQSLVLLLLLALLGGCSSTTFLYNRLDIIIPWYMRDYVSLERTQRDRLDQLLAPALDWHRREELPRYRQQLLVWRGDLDGQLSAAIVGDWRRELEAAFARVEARSVALMVSLGEGLGDEQIQQFLAKLDEQQVEFEQEYLQRSDEQYSEDVAERLRDSLGDTLGRLSSEQKTIIEAAAGNMWRADRLWLAERREWHAELREILRREPGWQQALDTALEARQDNTSQQYEDTYDNNAQVISGAIAEVLNIRTERQDRRLQRRIDGFLEDLDSLIAYGASD